MRGTIYPRLEDSGSNTLLLTQHSVHNRHTGHDFNNDLGESMDSELSDVRFLTVAEVAELMRVSKMTVYRMVHAGDLPAVKFGRSYRVPESAVQDAIAGIRGEERA